jgi:hypothetical protein
MPTMTARTPQVRVHVDHPRGWYFRRTAVPNLFVPRELFAVSNRPIRSSPSRKDQPRPAVADLDAGAIFIWAYSQTTDDPEQGNVDPLPDYSRFELPLQYAQSDVFPSTDAREWDPSKFLWRRIGFQFDETTVVTVWVWEGTSATHEDIAAASAILASIRPT